MPENTLEYLKRHLDAEEQSEKLQQVQGDLYSRVASYSQLLKRTSGSGNSEVANRLVARQSAIIHSMVLRLLETRLRKAMTQRSVPQLLPEERSVAAEGETYTRRLRALTEAVSSGQPSVVELVRRDELNRSITIRFVKHVDELVGLDLKKYGPFEPEDLASLPAANADLLVSNGEAVVIHSRSET